MAVTIAVTTSPTETDQMDAILRDFLVGE
jgi:hypothetical protein